MRIDRQRFLLLTATLSGGACTSSQAAAPPPREHTAVAPPEPAEPDEPNAQIAAVGSDEPATAADAGAPSAAVESTPAQASPPTTLSGDPKCNDMVGKPGKCQFTAPGPQCESFRDLKSECQLLTKHLKPKVAERAVKCIADKSGSAAICEFALPSRCATEAIRSGVCEEKSAAKQCERAVAKCAASRGSLTLEECKAGYSAVTARGKQKMLSCISEFCTVEHCLYQL